ncbi:MAG: 50S ribosomal protein L23 [Planctomycetota bacterium]
MPANASAIYIIRKPVLTEKTTEAMNEFGRYTFEVDRRATKREIIAAVEELYAVHVEGIETRTYKGKLKRLKYGYVRDSLRKHATVRLREGESIELF